MAKQLSDEQIDKIAQALAGKLAEHAGPAPLGCGSASSTTPYRCYTSGFECMSGTYECGGAAQFRCGSSTGNLFNCWDFNCYTNFVCDYFACGHDYNA
jgi:hypothetical protein